MGCLASISGTKCAEIIAGFAEDERFLTCLLLIRAICDETTSGKEEERIRNENREWKRENSRTNNERKVEN